MKTELKLIGVQYLRAVAALMVAYLHLRIQIPAYTEYLRNSAPFDTDRLGTGVDIFFVISGLVMMVSTQGMAPGKFFLRRLARIAPLYWLLTCLIILLASVAPSLFHSTHVSVANAIKSFLFIPYQNHPTPTSIPGPGGVEPILVPGWTLNLEMFFYAIFALLLFAPGKLRIWIGGIIFVALVVGGQWMQTPSHMPALWLYTRPIVFDFWIGMLIGECYLRGYLRLSAIAALVLIVAGAVTLLAPHPRISGYWETYAVASGALVLGVVGLEQAGRVAYVGWLALLGDASYSIYLTHLFALGFTRAIWVHLGINGGIGALFYSLFSVAMILLVAILSYRLIERPLMRLSKQWLSRSSTRTTGHGGFQGGRNPISSR